MKTGPGLPPPGSTPDAAAPIVDLAGPQARSAEASQAGERALEKARAFAEPLLVGHRLDTGEDAWAHAQGVAELLRSIGAAPAVRASAYLVYAGDFLARPDEAIGKAFGEGYASLVTHTRRLVQAQRAARRAGASAFQDREARQQRHERVRRMLMAFSRDLRVVLLRLSSRLQTLRYHAASRVDCPPVVAEEAMEVFAPLASRLGIWQIKWELEDLAFRFLHPQAYREVAAMLDQKRVVREASVEAARGEMRAVLEHAGLQADVQGRPKHLYSIWKKMQGKQLGFGQVFDLRALRVIVDDLQACYAALAAVQSRYRTLDAEFDDYIARPKPNGYQSLHAVILDDAGAPVEVQIRSRAMHEHAESGVAAHWAYKEAGARGYAGVAAGTEQGASVAAARKAVLRQLLAWERDVAAPRGGDAADGEDRIYVFTPQAAIVELPVGGTPIDFAYHLHTDLGHRCRGARVDGAIVALNTPLANGQTIEIVSAKDGGPSMDWLNQESGYLASPRSRAKVRAWFNARAQHETIARGREQVEKLLAREGRSQIKLDHLAEALGFRDADALFEVVGKDAYSLRNIEQWLRPAASPEPGQGMALHRSRASDKGGVLVVGVDSLMTSLARCCRPVPPDPIAGYVTRGRGVAVHRQDCANLRHMAERSPSRLIEVQWGAPASAQAAVYPADLVVEAAERSGLLRDISETLAKERLNLTEATSQPVRDAHGRSVRLLLTVEVTDAARLGPALRAVASLAGVRVARRR